MTTSAASSSDLLEDVMDLAIEYLKKSNWEHAKECFGMLLTARPSSFFGLMGLAYSFEKTKAFLPALQCYCLAAVNNPTNKLARQKALYCATELNDLKAVALLKDTLKN